MNDLMRPMPKPPANVEPFVKALGPELAVTFLLKFGGAELNIAESPRGGSYAQLVGHDAAKRLGEQGITGKRIPLAKRWLAGENAALARRTHRRHRPPPAHRRHHGPLLSEGRHGAMTKPPDNRAALAEVLTAAHRLMDALSIFIEGASEAPSNALEEDPAARHRRLHKPGSLSKIEADPALRAFIIERMHTMTFAETVAASAAAFPPGRRPSMSGLHRWWHRHGKALAGQPSVIR